MPKRGSSKFAKLRANSFRPKATLPKTSSRSLTRLAANVPRGLSGIGMSPSSSASSMGMAGGMPSPQGY
jgi:hypothetical protein